MSEFVDTDAANNLLALSCYHNLSGHPLCNYSDSDDNCVPPSPLTAQQ